MGKNKKKPNQNQNENYGQNQNQNENHGQNQNQNQEENNTDESVVADEKKYENANEKKNENTNEKGEDKTKETKTGKQYSGAIVLGVHLHCQGCVETVVKSLRGFEGVEEIEPNAKDSRVTVKVKLTDPVKVAERVRRKTGKSVELISPKPKKEPEKKDQDKKQEKKPEAPKVIETVLKIYLHCDGCAKDVKHCIHKMEGVHTVNVDMSTSHVTVKGTFDPKNLVAHISKKAGRHAEIVNPKNKQNNNKNNNNNKDNNNDGEKKQENEKNEKKEKGKDGKNEAVPYPPELFYAPQLFSDENPNACAIM